ncbi:MobF family relaxase [Nocardia noduli]|uniref:MobF family relaxase n=1 Tax=Nocardia noduli TaxID=2815722 RepID=UPI0020B238BB|nr:MobF family relaxase [Nocardia noduli]
MSLAKIASGDGYEYYLRNIATHDANERGPQKLADYYSERGESPGRWWGAGLADLDIHDDDDNLLSSITAGDQVTESQMWALYGRGLHPNAEALIAEKVAANRAEGCSARVARADAIRQVARIGAPFIRPSVQEYSYRAECRRAYRDWNIGHNRVPDAPIPDTDREYIATEVAQRMFFDEHGYDPRNSEELSSWVAKAARPTAKRNAAYDLTFSPVKSVSALWALSQRDLSDHVEACHHAALDDALVFLQQNIAYTRIGAGGVAQVEVGGLIATIFDHRDSRAGDPDLHTHVVISAKVRRRDGQWGALDSNMLYQHAVTASEIYNSRLEHHLETRLGTIAFVERAQTGVDPKRPIRELAGFDERLAAVWSTRGEAISEKIAAMAADFQARHGREPSPKDRWRMSEEATLSTRGGKHHARSRAEQRQDWAAEARRTLGGAAAVDAMVATMTNQAAVERAPRDPDLAEAAADVVDRVSQERATWRINHIRAEAVRRLRGHVEDAAFATALEQVVAYAVGDGLSIPRRLVDPAPMAIGLTRSDGTSVYTRADSTKYTSPQIVAAEARLLAAAQLDGARVIPASVVELAEIEYAANGHELNPGQRALVHACATSERRFLCAVAPAGTGKTTAATVLGNAWTGHRGNVIGIAPTAAAAAILSAETGIPAYTVDLLLRLAEHEPDSLPVIDANTLIILDEAAKTSTLKLDALVRFLMGREATIRAIGDDKQLSSVEAGGIIRDIVETTPSPTLTKVMRFADHGEAAASLALREGDPAGLAYYFDHHRVHVGTLEENVHAAFRAWRVDHSQGRDTAMLAPTRALVAELNALARAERLHQAERRFEYLGAETPLADGHSASAGDIITTRRNHRRLRISDTDYVRNGYRWEVRVVHDDGRITATHLGSGRRVILPADYVREHVGLGYATTIDSAQGMTVDRCHGVLTGRESRAQLYVMLTRGRTGNHLYLGTTSTDEQPAHAYDAVHPPTALDILTGVLAREGTQISATTQARDDADPHQRLAGEVNAYQHALDHIAETRLSPERAAEIATHAEQLAPGVTDAEAWPVLRAHLALIELSGKDPLQALTDAAAARSLATAADPAAVLDWRLDPTGHHSQGKTSGPLRWLPEIPAALNPGEQDHHHLAVRAKQITTMAEQIATQARTTTGDAVPLWARRLREADPALTAELAVWRAAHTIPDLDRRPTGPAQYAAADRHEQQRLDQAVAKRVGDLDTHTRRWRPVVDGIDERIGTDPYWPSLAAEFSRAAAAGVNIPDAVLAAHADRQLPAEQPAAAMRWRMAHTLDTERDTEFVGRIGEYRRDALRGMPNSILQAEIQQRHQARRPTMFDAAEEFGLTIGHNPVEQAREKLAQEQQRQQRLDQQVIAIHAARTAADEAKQAQMRYHEAAKARDQAQTALLRTARWRPAHRARQAVLDQAQTAADAARKELDAARKIADRAAAKTGNSSGWWHRVLNEAADHETRTRLLQDATDEIDTAQVKLDRITAKYARHEAHYQQAADERTRRKELPPEQRAREDQTRLEIWAQDHPLPSQQEIQRREQREAQRAEARERTKQMFRSAPRDHGPSRGTGHGLG